MRAEIITTGTELLLGEIVDTNAAFIARQLTTIGLDMYRKTTVGDNQERLANALKDALARAEVIIITGGLGPTVDDITREAVSDATGRELILREDLLAQIEAFFAKRGRSTSPNTVKQAYIPAGAIAIENPRGTAPSFIVEEPEGTIIALPGVPHEMTYLMKERIIPYLKERFGLKGVIKGKILRTCVVGESCIDELIGDLMRGRNPTVGLSAHPGQTDVRITAKAEDEARADEMIKETEAELRTRLGDIIFGADEETLEEVVASLLSGQHKTIAILETNTGGLIIQRLTSTNEGLSFLKEGLVVCDEETFARRLKLPRAKLERFGWISPQVALAASQRLKEASRADLGLAALGTMEVSQGPYAEERGKGYLALAREGEPIERSLPYGGQTEIARALTSNVALDMIRRSILYP